MKKRNAATKEISLNNYHQMMDGFSKTVFNVLPTQQLSGGLGTPSQYVANRLALK